MSEKTPARPRQVTWAAVLASGGSLFLLVAVFEMLNRLPSVQLRDQIEETLRESGVSVGIDQVMTLMRYGLMVTAVAAAVSLVAGVFVFQRHHGARIALSVAAVPILLTSPVTGVFMPLLVVMATSFAWSGPARDWFAGRPVRDVRPASRSTPSSTPPSPPPPPSSQAPQPGQPAQPAQSVGAPTGGGSTQVSTATTSQAPAAHQGYGEPRPAMPDPAAPGGPWSPQQPVRRVPTQVWVACGLTWVGGALVTLAMLATLAYFLLAPDQLRPALEEQVRAQGTEVPPGLLTAAVWTSVLLFSGWSVGAMLLAELVRRRHDWARYLLAVSAAAATVLSVLAGIVGLPTGVMGALTIAMLFRRETREWFAAPTHQQWPPHQSPGQHPGQHPGPPPPPTS